MFCPQCRSEYIEGVDKCPDCGKVLVEELPAGDSGCPADDAYYIPLVRTYSAKDVAMIHSILSNSNIRYYIRGENLTHLRPLADPSVLMVAEDDAGDAKELLRDLPLSFYPWSPDGGRSPDEESGLGNSPQEDK